MANTHRGEVSIHLDTIRKLKFTTNSLAELEDALGHSLSKLNSDDTGIKTMIKMFWAALLHSNPDLTIHEAGELMDYSNFTEISEKVAEALEISFGESYSKKESVKNLPSGRNGTGKN